MLGMGKRSGRIERAEMLKAYSKSPWLRAFIDRIATDVGTTTWQAFAVLDSPKGRAMRDLTLERSLKHSDRQQIIETYRKAGRLREYPNHPIIDFLTKANKWFPGVSSLMLTQQHLELVGEWAWLLELDKNTKMPIGYVPIPPTWVEASPSDKHPYWRVMGPNATWDIPRESLYMAYRPDPSNPFGRGAGLAHVLGDEIETDEHAARHVKDWFTNRAIPPVLISGLGVQLSELQRLEEKWLAKHSRVGAGWLPQFLGRDVKVHKLSDTFQAQQLKELRTWERDVMQQVFGVPPEQMGIVANSNRSTIDASDFIYQSRIVVPRLEFKRANFQATLVPRFNDERLVIDFVNPVREDMDFKLEAMKANPGAPLLDEWRALQGLPPLPGGAGKVHGVPVNVIYVRTDQLSTSAGPVNEPPADGGDGTPDVVNERMRPQARALPERRAIEPDDITTIVRAATLRALVRPLAPVMRDVVRAFGQDSLNGDMGKPEPERAAKANGIVIDFNLNDPAVIRFLNNWATDHMADTVNSTTRAHIRKALVDGMSAGETRAQIEARIKTVFADASASRIRTIADTEISRASNFGALQGMKQAGFAEKEWLSVLDDVTRDVHRELDGQVQPINQPFSVFGYAPMFPGDFGSAEQDCNCRCSVITAEARKRSIEVRTAMWKTIESDRAPFIRRMRVALDKAFKDQEAAVLEALESAWSKGRALDLVSA